MSNISFISIEMTSFNCLFHLANSINSNSKFVMYWIWIGSYQETEKMDFNWNVHFDQLHLKDTNAHRHTRHEIILCEWCSYRSYSYAFIRFCYSFVSLFQLKVCVFFLLICCSTGISCVSSFIGVRCWWQWVIYTGNRHKELLDVFFSFIRFRILKLYWIRR